MYYFQWENTVHVFDEALEDNFEKLIVAMVWLSLGQNPFNTVF